METYHIVDRTTSSPVVSIVILAYQHAGYISQTLDSVLMQQTNYDFKIIIAEDASPDNTRDIIVEYQKQFPDKIKLILQNRNVGAQQNCRDLFNNLEGKYIAALEGDDHWTDPLKLQKQVDYLEKNPDFSMTFGNAKIQDETGTYHKSQNYLDSDIPKVFLPEETISMGLPTLTMVFRNTIMPDIFSYAKSGDLFLRLILSLKGKFYYHGEVFGTHRKHAGGASRLNNRLDWNLDTAKYLKKFRKICLPVQKDKVDNMIVMNLLFASFNGLYQQKYLLAAQILLKAVLLRGFWTRQGFGTFRYLFNQVIIKRNEKVLDIF